MNEARSQGFVQPNNKVKLKNKAARFIYCHCESDSYKISSLQNRKTTKSIKESNQKVIVYPKNVCNLSSNEADLCSEPSACRLEFTGKKNASD